MSRRRQNKPKEDKPKLLARVFAPDARLLVTVGLPISILAGIFLGNSNGALINLPVCYVWFTGIFFFYLLWLGFFGRYVLPPTASHPEPKTNKDTDNSRTTVANGLYMSLSEEPSTREGILLVMNHAFFHFIPSRVRMQMGYGSFPIKEPLPPSMERYRAGFIPSHYVLVIGQLANFSRLADPGYVRLAFRERVMKVIDLRMQFRAKPAKFITQDGLQLNTYVSALFSVRKPNFDPNIHNHVAYPFIPDHVFRLIWGDSKESGNDINWSDRLTPSIESLLAGMFARYELNDLLLPPGHIGNTIRFAPQGIIRRTLRIQFSNLLEDIFQFEGGANNPLNIYDMDFSELTQPDQVIEQRIENWGLRLLEEETRNLTLGQMQVMNSQGRARIRNEQMQIINLQASYASIQGIPEDVLQVVRVLRVIEALDRIIDYGSASELASRQTITLASLLSDYLLRINQ